MSARKMEYNDATGSIIFESSELGWCRLMDYADEWPKVTPEEKEQIKLAAAAPALLEALNNIHELWCCPQPKRMKDWAARCDVMADYARAAIAAAGK